jgi:predicted nucleotidyltransferase component of viral defense system
MKEKGRNMSASVQARLLHLSRASKLSLQDLLERYCIERLLYRLSVSPHRSRFILKGAMLLIVWGEGSSERVTRDADLLGFGDNSPLGVTTTFREILAVPIDNDGVVFEPDSVVAEPIRAEQEYVGMRVTLRARVGNARIPVQADIGFGDAYAVEPEEIEFPSLLDLPRPSLRAYSKETALAEKFEAIVVLGERNTRMKDFFDVWLLSNRFDFEGLTLSNAFISTFGRRRTEIPTTTPVGLSPQFAADPMKAAQWKAFWRKAVRTEPTPTFVEVVDAAREFLIPVATAAQSREPWTAHWVRGGPWRQGRQP